MLKIMPDSVECKKINVMHPLLKLLYSYTSAHYTTREVIQIVMNIQESNIACI